MNKKTARMLKRMSEGNRQLYQSMKREWQELSGKERGRRKRAAKAGKAAAAAPAAPGIPAKPKA
jgi:hypothetical protein